MSFIDDMKIGKKLTGGFLIVVLILVVVAAIGYMNMGALDKADTELYQDRTVPLGQLGSVDADLQQMRAELYRYVYVPSARSTTETTIANLRVNIKKEIDAYRATSLTPSEKTSLASFDSYYAQWDKLFDDAIAAADKNDMKTVDAALTPGSPLINARTGAVTAITDLVTINTDEAKKLSDANTALYSSSSMTMIIATIVGVIIAIALALFLSKSITAPLDLASKNLKEMGMGHLGNRMKMSRKDEIGEMATVMDSFSDNLQNAVVGTLKKIADGDLTTDVKAMDAHDEIAPALIATTTALRALVTDTNMLAKAAGDGKLDTRADASKQKGDYKKIIEGVNATLDNIVGPLNVSAEYVDRISKGDIPAKITDTYNGDFNEIKNNLNNCIDVMNGLLAETNGLIKATKEGKLDTRGNSQKFPGGWGTLVGGVNELVDAFVHPINVTAEYVDRISKGDIPPKITDTYNGDFNEIKNNLNNCIDVMNGLLAETNGLIKATKEGKLDTRGNSQKYPGGWGKLVGGVNELVDAFVQPINVTAEYVDRISKGDIPPKITDIYNGDFNEIKNNLNNCIDVMNGLLDETNGLIKATQDGKLQTRGNAQKFNGGWGKLVGGVNDLIEAFVHPIKVTSEYIDRISKGEVPKKITDTYNGDFNEIKNNLNNCIEGLQGLVECDRVLHCMAMNDHTQKVDGNYQGIFASTAESTNTVRERLLGVTKQINEISMGDTKELPDLRKVGKRSEQDHLLPAIINCLETVDKLLVDTRMLAKAAADGKLDTRADASKHQGEYRVVVEGINKTLDSVIGPLNVAAEYVDRISKGDIPTKISDTYNGDFNEIKNNLNNCIDAVNALVADAAMLAKAADEGKLKTRADATKHNGDYKKIVLGVNQTLDSVIEPVNEALRVSKGYATQDFTTRVDPNLKVPGDWLAFKEALNNIGIAVSAAVTNISSQVTDLAAGAEEANASVEEVTAGAGQVAKNTSAVSTNVEKSMAGIEQVQKAMEDLSRTIQEVATRADVTAKLVQDTTTYSKEGMDLARKTENGMQGITKSSNEVNVIILEIKGQMDKISEIVNLITDLANQTNLLALNAAIEAARAGDAGRGFAVVATEVKSLAVESRASAEKISEMINNLQQQTNSAVDAVASANSGVKVGSEALHDTLTSFSKIVESIDQVSKNVSDVAAAAEEQAASVEEVTASVNEVGGLMQSTAKESTDAAAASEESAAAIDQISKVIGNVNTIVDKVTKEVSKFKC